TARETPAPANGITARAFSASVRVEGNGGIPASQQFSQIAPHAALRSREPNRIKRAQPDAGMAACHAEPPGSEWSAMIPATAKPGPAKGREDRAARGPDSPALKGTSAVIRRNRTLPVSPKEKMQGLRSERQCYKQGHWPWSHAAPSSRLRPFAR